MILKFWTIFYVSLTAERHQTGEEAEIKLVTNAQAGNTRAFEERHRSNLDIIELELICTV